METEATGRVPISVTLPPAAIQWLDRKVESRVYASRSHAVEVLILSASRQESSAGSGFARPAGFQIEREFTISSSEPEANDLTRSFTKALNEAWNMGAHMHVLKVAVKGQKEPKLFYRLKDLGTNCSADSTRQEYLAISEELQVVRLVVVATRGPDGMGASVEAEQTVLGPEEAKQFGLTHDQMVAVVERFLNGDLY